MNEVCQSAIVAILQEEESVCFFCGLSVISHNVGVNEWWERLQGFYLSLGECIVLYDFYCDEAIFAFGVTSVNSSVWSFTKQGVIVQVVIVVYSFPLLYLLSIEGNRHEDKLFIIVIKERWRAQIISLVGSSNFGKWWDTRLLFLGLRVCCAFVRLSHRCLRLLCSLILRRIGHIRCKWFHIVGDLELAPRF